jgi:hypothetical protein
MQTINHQFSSESFYIPTWEVKHLFVGSFNPEGGARVPYYYGREKNQLWPLLSEIFGAELNPSSDDFWELLRRHKIARVDMPPMYSLSAGYFNTTTELCRFQGSDGQSMVVMTYKVRFLLFLSM